MKLSIFLSLILTLALSTTLHARPDPESIRIRLPTARLRSPYDDLYDCESWRLAAEVNNARNWKVVPSQCIEYIGNYMTAKDEHFQTQYEADCLVVVSEAMDYLSKVKPTPGKNDTWLFGLTDTLISDLPYYNRSDIKFGGTLYNKTKYNEYLKEGDMPPVPIIDKLYYEAKAKGFKVVILSGIDIEFQSIMEDNLRKAGITGWDLLILKDKPKMPKKDFKASMRAQLKKDGYKVIGNIGDQWTDLLTGSNAGKRTFKMPNPMYYVS